MSQNLKSEFNLPSNVHAHEVKHTRKEYQCEQCFDMIPIGSFCIILTEEKQQQYGTRFENKKFCTKRCFTQYVIPKYPIYSKEPVYAGTDKGDY